MKRFTYAIPLVLIVVLLIFRSHLLQLVHPAPGTYPAAEATHVVGRYETIVGRVVEVSISQSGTVFLDFGADYPNQSFTAVIPADAVGRFVALDSYKNQRVGVTGRLDLYHGKPEIVVTSPRQVRLFVSAR